MDHTEQEQQDAVNQVYEYAANLLVKEKKRPNEVKGLLVEQGLDEQSAHNVVASLEGQIKEAKKERGKKDMLYGALWAIGGTVVTVATYSAAEGGGTYVVAYGAIILGAVQFIKGAVNSAG